MTAPIEILVEIVAQEADASATPPLSEVVVRGSDRGKVLTNGKSYANFQVIDAQITQRANFFGAPGQRPQSYLELSYDETLALHDEYNLAGKAVLVRVGRGDSDDDYNKPSTGTTPARCYVWRGFVPSDWAPSPLRDRSSCRLLLAEPLGYKSFPVLTDRITAADYPTAPDYVLDRLFPILFGSGSPFPGSSVPLFPMYCVVVGSQDRDNKWALGNLPLEDHPDSFHDVFRSIYDYADIGISVNQKDRANAQVKGLSYEGGYLSENVTPWTYSGGIATSVAQPLPSVANGSLIKAAGHVLYWLLRYKGDASASSIGDTFFYGTKAPYQLKTTDDADASIYYMLDRAIETAPLLAEIANEFLVVLRQVDGHRQSAGMTPVWSIADRAVPAPSKGPSLPLLLDPAWLRRDPQGEADIRQLGVHPLYANLAQLEFGRFPFVTRTDKRPFYLDASLENATDQADNGVVEKRFSYRFSAAPDQLIGDATIIEGLCSDRWGRFTEEDPVSLYGFSLRLPMGDVLVGDMIDFGRLANGTDGKRRYYFIEQTQLSWQTRQLDCLASRFGDRPPTRLTETIWTDPIGTTRYTSQDRYPLVFSKFLVSTTRLATPHLLVYGFQRSGVYFEFASGLDIESLTVTITGTLRDQAGTLSLYKGTQAPPTPASPWPGWDTVANSTLLHTWPETAQGSFDLSYTLTGSELTGLSGGFLWFICDWKNNTGTSRSSGVRMKLDVTHLRA